MIVLILSAVGMMMPTESTPPLPHSPTPLPPCSPPPCGVIYVAYGDNARREAAASAASLREHNDYPAAVIGREPLAGVDHFVPFAEAGPGARWAKLNLDSLSPWPFSLYLDADTRVKGSVAAGFQLLAGGWELVLAPSGRQGADVLGHLPVEDRAFTLADLENAQPLQLQAGVMFVNLRSERVRRLFAVWREEWARFQDQDQGALLRALRRQPLRVWLLGGVWNSAGGEVVGHRFGKAR